MATKKRSSSTVRRVVIIATLAVVAYLGMSIWFMLLQPQVRVPAGRTVRVSIPEGSGTTAIGRSLAGAGVVPNALAFRLVVRLTGADGHLRAGVYELRTGTSYSDAIAALRKGPDTDIVVVTIPEGFVIDQVAERFAKQADISKADLLRLAKGGAPQFSAAHPYLKGAYGGSLEGYLFPKTYQVRRGAAAADVIEMMLDQFDREIASVDVGSAQASGISLKDLVIMASMIERETKLANERALVSSVIRNRLARGMKLEIDATIEYVLPGNHFRLTNRQIRIDSPYNTYRYAGLPVGPIANPGLASLQAAAHPAQTAYLYYVLTGKDGSHTFATNKADFLVAKRKSKEVFGR